MAAENHLTVLGLRAIQREARKTGDQFLPLFQGFMYAYALQDVSAAAHGWGDNDIPLVLLKVGIASVFNLGERLDGELAGANDDLLEWLRNECNGSLRNVSAWFLERLYKNPDKQHPALVFIGPIDIGYEREYCRSFGLPMAMMAYAPLLQPVIDSKLAAAAALPLPDEPEIASHPNSDPLFTVALSALQVLQGISVRVSRERSTKRSKQIADVVAYLDAAQNPNLPSAADFAPVLEDFITQPRSDVDRGRRFCEALCALVAALEPLVEQRKQRTKALAARAEAAAFAADPGAAVDLFEFTLGANGAVSWKTLLGKRAATNLGPTELVLSTAARIASVRRDGLAALRNGLQAARPARVILRCGAQEHTFIPFSE
jgi:hypothetical protein